MNTAAVDESPAETQDLSILVAASSSFMRSLNAVVLSDEFHVVDVASTGVETLDLLQDQQPDVIVADRDLNIKDGLELAREATSASPDVGIVLVCDSTSSLEAEADDHVDEVVTRPFQMHGLIEAVIRAASHNGVGSVELHQRVNHKPYATFSSSDHMPDVSARGATNTLLLTPVDAPEEALICRDLLIEQRCDALVGVAVTRTADQWLREFSNRLPSFPPSVEVIDVGAEVRSTAAASPDPVASQTEVTIHPVSSPGNLTDFGVTLTEAFDTLEAADDGVKAMMCFDDLTALAQHHDPKPLFQFLEVLTSTCEAQGVRAHYHVHPGTVDEKAINSWKLLCNTHVCVDEDGDVTVQSR